MRFVPAKPEPVPPPRRIERKSRSASAIAWSSARNRQHARASRRWSGHGTAAIIRNGIDADSHLRGETGAQAHRCQHAQALEQREGAFRVKLHMSAQWDILADRHTIARKSLVGGSCLWKGTMNSDLQLCEPNPVKQPIHCEQSSKRATDHFCSSKQRNADTPLAAPRPKTNRAQNGR
eukprot:762753-Pleurochrysis_carterae.AAC.1